MSVNPLVFFLGVCIEPSRFTMFLYVGLVSIGTFLALEWTKPSLIYDPRTGQPKSEIFTPVTLAVAAGLLTLAYLRKTRMMPSGSGGSAMQAQVVSEMPVAELDGFQQAPDISLPPDTFNDM
jgi:hypothetical protein